MTLYSDIYSQLQKAQQVLLKQNIPFVSYRLPQDKEVVTLVQAHSMPERVSDLNELVDTQGFVLAPFTPFQGAQSWFLKPDGVFLSEDIDEFYIEKLTENNRFLHFPRPVCELHTSTYDEFTSNVEQAVAAITRGEFHKVVLSKVRVEDLPEDFNAAQFFHKLCDQYPHAMVYLFQFPEAGCWIGATPEPLLVVEHDRVKTVSLAGTQLATGAPLSDYQWTKKEIEEQAIVTNFVAQSLDALGVKEYDRQGPENYQAANLIHLKTAFDFPKSPLASRFSEFVNALHPTPSVGGLPKAKACEFICSKEQHVRSYYTGFLGPLNMGERTDLFVNLRCIQLFEDRFVLYSGAGITAGSVPVKEWEETDNKMCTMLNVMAEVSGC